MKKECVNCNLKYKRFVDEGIAYHSYKLSNGYDYDSYTSVCDDQDITRYKKQALDKITKEMETTKEKLKILRHSLEEIKHTDRATAITRHLELLRL